MPLPKVHKYIQDQNGNIVPEVLCSVYNQGTGVLASLWQNDAGTVPLSNPLTSDAQYGSVQFYINPGHFDLSFTKPGYTFQTIYDFQVVEDVLTLGTMATQNANAVAITGGSVGGLTQMQATRLALNTTIDPTKQLAINGAVIVTAGPVEVQGSTRLERLGINRAPAADVHLHIEVLKNANYGLALKTADNDTGANAAMLFANLAGGAIGSITTTATGTSYNTTSDGRLKEAVTALPHALETITGLSPVQFRWKATGQSGQGFIAQEVYALVPHAVSGDPDDPAATLQLDFSKLIPHLVGAVQTLTRQVEALTARLEAAGA